MKISLEWLSDFVDILDIEPDVIAERLTMATAEVEGFETIERAVGGIVVGEVVSVTPIETETGGDSKLVVATVDTGDRRLETVCGAPNVRPGIKAPFAPLGSRLAGGVEISLAEVGGRKSEGVLCSAKELGFGDSHEGLLLCPASLETGASLSRYISARDVLFEVDNKSLTNRPDLWGHYGFAREIAAIFGRPLRPLAQADLARFADLPAFLVKIEDMDLCSCYTAIEFEVDAMAPAPLHIQARLHMLGQRAFGMMIDLTNYVMLETGQPTHAFDAALVRKIRVATCGSAMTFKTLDGVERQMLASDLMIWNEEHPVALAGIMGGLESEVREATSRVLLESANFKGSQVRRTSTRLGLRTEASQRFEKNQPPANARTASARILQLLEDNGVRYRATSSFSLAGELHDSFRPLNLSVRVIQRAAGFPIPNERILSILGSLGFRAEEAGEGVLQLGLPPFRSEQDISIPADVTEEVLRIYGYDNVPPKLPVAKLKPVYIDNLLQREHKAQRTLSQGHRFTEVHTYIWTDDFWLGKIGFDPSRTLVLKNPSAEGKRQLRTTLMPNMLALVDQNRNMRSRFRLFEVGRIFLPDDEKGCSELTHLAGVSFISSAEEEDEDHYLSVKGAVEDVARVIQCGELQFQKDAGASDPWKAGWSWATAWLRNEMVGEIGTLTGPLREICAPGGQVVWFEMNLSRMSGPLFTEATYEAPPVYPLSWQDFTMLWSLKKGYAELRAILENFSHPFIKSLEFHGLYKGQETSELGSYTFRFWLGAARKTLDGEDLEQFHKLLLYYLASNGITLK